jgi:hypothetical protein
LIPFWWKKLFSDEAFGAKVASRWSELRSGAYADDQINARIDSLTALLSESQERNFAAWKVLGKYVWPNRYVGNTFSQEVAYLKTWIAQRLSWMDANMPALITASPKTHTEAPVLAAPNPFEGSVSIQYTITAESIVHVRIFDALGRPVNSASMTQPVSGTYRYTWDAAHSGTGLYYFQIFANNNLLGAGKLIRR